MELTYFFRSGDKVKIGYTSSPAERLKQLRQHQDGEYVLLMTGGRLIEKSFHDQQSW